jgi:hypothetical protein
MKTKFTHLWQLLGQTITAAKVYLQGYKSYKVALSQAGTSAPVVVSEIENTLGWQVSFQYSGVGLYYAIIDKASQSCGFVFPFGEVGPFCSSTIVGDNQYAEVSMTPSYINTGADDYSFSATVVWWNVIELTNFENGVGVNGLMNDNYPTILEIKVYNK